MGFLDVICSLFRHDPVSQGQPRKKTREEGEDEVEEEEQEELVALDII
jgi:hypothetical protein